MRSERFIYWTYIDLLQSDAKLCLSNGVRCIVYVYGDQVAPFEVALYGCYGFYDKYGVFDG